MSSTIFSLVWHHNLTDAAVLYVWFPSGRSGLVCGSLGDFVLVSDNASAWLEFREHRGASFGPIRPGKRSKATVSTAPASGDVVEV